MLIPELDKQKETKLGTLSALALPAIKSSIPPLVAAQDSNKYAVLTIHLHHLVIIKEETLKETVFELHYTLSLMKEHHILTSNSSG